MGLMILRMKSLSANSSLFPDAILCSLSSSFKIHGYACMHKGYVVVNFEVCLLYGPNVRLGRAYRYTGTICTCVHFPLHSLL